MTTNKPRGRPRRFDPEEAVATAQRLFHARGYDAVGVADVTQALGINPPSFYAAFGSKAGLYDRVLERYARTMAIPLPEILRADRPVAEALAEMLDAAAHHYAADPVTAGCMVIEGSRCDDPGAREATRAFHVAAQKFIRDYIAVRHPDEAGDMTDFVCTTMAGLSAAARDGQDVERLRATARIASLAIRQVLAA
ncbi:TetR/AcrR family transcriptional regulator [Novosphingobium kaempferiae]|uniref:TetR/AcrR family transcriptional regulator n=1 Tax=Novosphingobium kaempferiae TaxID=2896849 RepID=UPI001E39AB5C|nr:TetR/AcrR family transcriptional regulator [Novosphingobium kaempferiae]